MIRSDNISFPFLEPTTSGLACSLQGDRGSDGVYSVGALASSQADHLITCVKSPTCDWAAARGSTLPHIATCGIGVIEKHDLFFGHNWVSMWIKIQLQFANCIIFLESCYSLLKLKSTSSHWIIWSFCLRLIQFWSLIKLPSSLLLFHYHIVLEYLQVPW